jgi:hypothetical protein
MFGIYRNNLIFFEKFGIFLCYPQITPLRLINYIEEIIVNIINRRYKYSYKTVAWQKSLVVRRG